MSFVLHGMGISFGNYRRVIFEDPPLSTFDCHRTFWKRLRKRKLAAVVLAVGEEEARHEVGDVGGEGEDVVEAEGKGEAAVGEEEVAEEDADEDRRTNHE